MKKYILLAVVALFSALNMSAQINDGQLPGTRWRVLLPMNVSYKSEGGNHSIVASPQLMFKQPITKWLAVEAVANYNIKNEAFSPKIWLGFCFGRLFILERNNYNCKTEKFSTGLAATYKITNTVGIDMTWDDISMGKEWFDNDRLQFVASYGSPNKKFNINAGYSCRYKSGFIANARYNITSGCRLQGKVDCGAKSVTAMFIWDFN